MEVNRRNFLKFAVGGVAGLHVTPLPWKLMDDVAIWTQNWPWVPVPPDGEFKTVSSVCTLCPGGCGIAVRKVDKRAVKIEGRTDFPVNPGGICPVGAGGLQLLYNESIRFTGPMKRAGMRGSGNFLEISWDEALDMLATRLNALRKEGLSTSVAAVNGFPSGSTSALLVDRFMEAYGSPNTLRLPSLETTLRTGAQLMQGTCGPLGYDLENSDYVLSFGAGLLEGWGAPARVMNAWSLWHSGNPSKRRTIVVQVESRASNTASKADKWVAPKPGTEAALALGLAHVLIKEGLLDTAFVDTQCFGYHDWSGPDGAAHMGFKTMVLKDYTPERVSEMTGVDTKKILSLAREFGKAKAPVALYGKGKNEANGSVYEFMAVHALNALKGRLDKRGGAWSLDPLPFTPLPPVQGDAVTERALRARRLDQAGASMYPLAQSLPAQFSEAVIRAKGAPVDTLMVFASNPGYTLPDAGAFMEALKRIPFIVSFSPYRDETALMADLVLPDHTYLEKTEDVLCPSGLQYPFFSVTRPVVDPVYRTRNAGDTLIALARKTEGPPKAAFPWKGFEDVLKERCKGLMALKTAQGTFQSTKPPWTGASTKPGFDSFDALWKRLTAGGFLYCPLGEERQPEKGFATPSRRFELFSLTLFQAFGDAMRRAALDKLCAEMGISARGDVLFMPHYEPMPPRADTKAFPLRLVPYGIVNLSSSWISSPPFLYKTLFDHQLLKDKSFAMVHPKTAASLGLNQGDLATLQSPAGSATVRVNLFQGACPGTVYLLMGLGHTGYDAYQKNKGVNPNDLILAGRDPLNGDPVWWNTPVKLTKA